MLTLTGFSGLTCAAADSIFRGPYPDLLEPPLANTAQARKRARQAQKHRLHNASRRSLLRTRIKQVVKAIDGGDKAAAEGAYAVATPIIDRMVKTDLIHRNKANRHKSRLNARIKAMAQA